MRKNLDVTRRQIGQLQNDTEQQKKSKKTTTPIKILKTAQSLAKAKNRVKKFLPLSPHHKKELFPSLANDFGIECHVRWEIANGNKGLPQETIDKVKFYYLESSWTCPGRKDFVIVYENNNKEKKQKHYLLTTLKEAYSVFCNENPNEFHDFTAKLVCNQESEECIFGICCDCPSITILTPEIDYNDIS